MLSSWSIEAREPHVSACSRRPRVSVQMSIARASWAYHSALSPFCPDLFAEEAAVAMRAHPLTKPTWFLPFEPA